MGLDYYAIIWQAKTMVNKFTVNKGWQVRLAALAIASLMAARSYWHTAVSNQHSRKLIKRYYQKCNALASQKLVAWRSAEQSVKWSITVVFWRRKRMRRRCAGHWSWRQKAIMLWSGYHGHFLLLCSMPVTRKYCWKKASDMKDCWWRFHQCWCGHVDRRGVETFGATTIWCLLS